MWYKIKCQYWKQVLRKKGERIPSIYKHVSDLWHQTKVTMLGAQAWKRSICFTLYIKVEIYLQKPKLLFICDLRAATPTNPMEWVSVHLMADTPKSKTWMLYKTGIMVKVSQYHTFITKLQTDRAVYFHFQLKEVLKYSTINITNRLQKRLIIWSVHCPYTQ